MSVAQRRLQGVELVEVERLARAEMTRAGLGPEWSLAWDHARRRAGRCVFATKTISLSKPLMKLYDEAAVREVVAHEIAHALVGPGHNHDAAWRAAARRLGSTGRSSLPATLPSPPPTWVGTCPNGHTVGRYRTPTRTQSCSRCCRRFDRRYLITWEKAPDPRKAGSR